MEMVSSKALKSRVELGRTGRSVPWPPLILGLPAALIAALVMLPIVYLMLRALGAGGELWDLLFRARTFQILVRTVILVAAVTTLTVLISLPLAWVTIRTDLPLRRIWSVLTTLPLVIPSYVAGFVIVAALGPRGMLQQILAGPFGLERLPELYGFPGALLTISMVSYPYVLLALQTSIRGLDPCLEEASHNLGHGPWSTFRRVTLPQLRPAIAAGALLVALYTLRDFGAVSLMRYETFTWAIYLQYQTSFDRKLAAGLSLVLVVIAIVILFIEVRTRGKARYHRSAVSVGHATGYTRLGRWRWPAFFLCAAVVLLTLILPMSVLGYWLIRGVLAGEPVRLVWISVLNSTYVSSLAAIATTICALPLAILAVRYAGRLSGLLEQTAYIGFALPGIVIALALVFFGANFATPVYQTLVLLIFAYVILFLPQAISTLRSSLVQVSPRLEEAARSLGRTPVQTWLTVTLPLVRPGILAGAALVFLTTMKELPATLLLSPIGFKTLATSIWSATSEAFFARAAGPALLLILVSAVPMALFAFRQQRR